MGNKGDKMTENSVIEAELLLEKLAPINGITSKKMFGGHGIFHEGKMFGIIDSKGVCFIKADETTMTEFLGEGSEKHSKMPYYSIPLYVFNDNTMLLDWAKKAIELSK